MGRRIQRKIGTAVVLWLAMVAAAVHAEPSVAMVEQKTLTGRDDSEWLDLLGIQANEITVLTQLPAYGAVPVTYVVNRDGKIVSGHLGDSVEGDARV